MKRTKEIVIKDGKGTPRIILGWDANLIDSKEAEVILKKSGIEVNEKN